jgi:hypothetical protein
MRVAPIPREWEKIAPSADLTVDGRAVAGRQHLKSFHVERPAEWMQIARFTWNTRLTDHSQTT